ncbi:MAG: hypothetical protein N4A71_22185 [Carboxylicivirga sp.]|jgi:hypothetical protein|nr:hypothetical protein [Carboxylicivirga sp.]MCT4645812.1 hypothetical protein [Carboxylicivirga sp.]
MFLQEFINNPYFAYIKAERYINNGSPSGFSHRNSTSQNTKPRGTNSSFKLSKIKFNETVIMEDIGVYKHSLIEENCIYIHPDMLESQIISDEIISKKMEGVQVAPTASGRTVLMNNYSCFIKLAYIGYLGRLIRHMNKEIIQSAIEVTNQLMKAADSKKLNCSFSFLREDFGRVGYLPINALNCKKFELPINKNGYYEWGVLFREVKPYPYVDEKEILIPFFALFSKEYDPVSGCELKEQDFPLIIQLYNLQSKSIEDFLLEDLLYPLFNTYFDALIYAGVELEAHAQNMLIATDTQFKIKRIVCRDLESAGRDVPLMNYFGIEYIKHGNYKFNNINPIELGSKYSKYTTNHSFMFDFKLGEYLVSPLLDTARKYMSFDIKNIEDKIKSFNKQFLDLLPQDFFPKDWCRYDNINWDLEKRKREYLWLNNPKYR